MTVAAAAPEQEQQQEPATVQLPRIVVVTDVPVLPQVRPGPGADPLPPAAGDLGTLRLLLRPVDADGAFAVLAGDPPAGMEMAPGYPSPHSLDLLGNAAGGSPQDVGPFFVVRRADHALVGEIGCALDAETGTAHVAYTIAEPCRNLGYATEALRALLTHLLDEVGAHTVRAETLASNGASRRVLEKAGMRPCARRRGEAGSPAAVICYEAVAGSWSLPLPFSTSTRGSSRRSRARRARPFVPFGS